MEGTLRFSFAPGTRDEKFLVGCSLSSATSGDQSFSPRSSPCKNMAWRCAAEIYQSQRDDKAHLRRRDIGLLSTRACSRSSNESTTTPKTTKDQTSNLYSHAKSRGTNRLRTDSKSKPVWLAGYGYLHSVAPRKWLAGPCSFPCSDFPDCSCPPLPIAAA